MIKNKHHSDILDIFRTKKRSCNKAKIQKKYFDGMEQRKNGRSNKYFCTWQYSTVRYSLSKINSSIIGTGTYSVTGIE